MTKALVKTEPIIRASDSLSKISEMITDKLKRWDVFDLNVRLSAVKRILTARDLEYNHPEFEADGVVVIVVGKKGADFDEHERNR